MRRVAVVGNDDNHWNLNFENGNVNNDNDNNNNRVRLVRGGMGKWMEKNGDVAEFGTSSSSRNRLR
ncbi:MAG: hypothetical protein WCK49_08190 [Myxococcaceae bacterium]